MVVFLWPSRDQCYPGGGFKGFTLFPNLFYLYLGKMLQFHEYTVFLQMGCTKKKTQLVLVETQLQRHVSSWHSASLLRPCQS